MPHRTVVGETCARIRTSFLLQSSSWEIGTMLTIWSLAAKKAHEAQRSSGPGSLPARRGGLTATSNSTRFAESTTYSYYDEHRSVQGVDDGRHHRLQPAPGHCPKRIWACRVMPLWRLGSSEALCGRSGMRPRRRGPARQKRADLPPGDLILAGEATSGDYRYTQETGKRFFEYDEQSDLFTDESLRRISGSYKLTRSAPRQKKWFFPDRWPRTKWTPKILTF